MKHKWLSVSVMLVVMLLVAGRAAARHIAPDSAAIVEPVETQQAAPVVAAPATATPTPQPMTTEPPPHDYTGQPWPTATSVYQEYVPRVALGTPYAVERSK